MKDFIIGKEYDMRFIENIDSLVGFVKQTRELSILLAETVGAEPEDIEQYKEFKEIGEFKDKNIAEKKDFLDDSAVAINQIIIACLDVFGASEEVEKILSGIK